MKNQIIKLRIGILCSGNTCRSPVLSAWIQHFAKEEFLFEIWTAGMNMKETDFGLPVPEEAILAVTDMKLNSELISVLQAHKSKKVEVITEPADFIFWITEFETIYSKKEDSNDVRIDFIKKLSVDKNSILIIIPEKDTAWETKNDPNKTNEEKCIAYKNQSEKLKQWAKIICKTIIEK